MRKVVLCVSLLALTAGVSTATAQTCTGALTCNTSSIGYTILNSGTESQRRLIATGIYTPDGKVNLEKAHEMGWDRQWAQRKAVADMLALAQQHR